jgi:diguanylate cyclase (GGDEF)-like protein
MNMTKRLAIKYEVGADYAVPSLPDELKHAKTGREKKYLEIIEELMTVVKQDPMTGLQHKEHFRSQMHGPGVFIMVDADGLKKMNDTYGHEAGHAVILAVSAGIKATLRSKDKATVTPPKADASRVGGDEFLVHIENIPMSAGVAVAKRMLDNFHKQKLSDYYEGNDNHIKEALNHLTLKATLGVGYTEEDADAAMYKAKQKGRNRVEFHRVLKKG